LKEEHQQNEGGSFPEEFLNRCGNGNVRELFSEIDLKVYDISEMVGHKSEKNFARVFKRQNGCTPFEYRATRCWGRKSKGVLPAHDRDRFLLYGVSPKQEKSKMSKNDYQSKIDQSWRIFSAIVGDVDAWLDAVCGYITPARTAFHILLGVGYCIENCLESPRRCVAHRHLGPRRQQERHVTRH
jgi:hypothetical protein